MPDTNFKNFIDALTETNNPSGYFYVRTPAGNRKIKDTNLMNPVTNDIGIPGELGFGVGLCATADIPSTLEALPGTLQKSNDQYGNYRVKVDGSIMCYIPRIS